MTGKGQNVPLVRQTDEEEFLMRFEEIKTSNLTAKERNLVDDWEEKYGKALVGIAWGNMGLSREQISALSEQQFRGLERVLERRVGTLARMQKFILFPLASLVLTPVFLMGIFLFVDTAREDGGTEFSDAWQYIRYRSRLKKKFGDNYSLYRRFHQKS